MNRKWFEVQYLEWFSGPGCLLDEATGEELPGSPPAGARHRQPFDRYVFSDRSKSCADALSARVAAMRKKAPGLPPTDVLTGECDAGVLAWPPSSRTCGLIAP